LEIRTDLALERHQLSKKEKNEGIIFSEYYEKNIKVTQIEVENENGEQNLGKPIGKYITLEVTPFEKNINAIGKETLVIGEMLESLLPKTNKPILIACLGNDSITPDALGPSVAQYIFATRHIEKSLAEKIGLGDIKSVAVICTGVSGKTGIEAKETVKSLARQIDAGAVIAVDALASRHIQRVGATVQISSSGIVPGSGVGNARFAISEKTIGVPVISIGVPTVVDGATLAMDIIEKAGQDQTAVKNEILSQFGEGIFVTPKDIDMIISSASKILAMAINCAIQKSLTPQEIFSIVSG